MKRTMKNLMILFLISVLLCGCGRQKYNGEPLELWLVTEQSIAGGMNSQAEIAIEQFKEIYPNVAVKMDILPQSEESRTAYLKKIRSEIMSGGGPDLYLMPTYELAYPETEITSTDFMEPLFASVPKQMYNGVFTDIGEYYDADETLGKDGLVTGVMDESNILPASTNASISMIEFQHEVKKWRLLNWNITDHLNGLHLNELFVH